MFQSGDEEDNVDYLCPNQVLIGRTSNDSNMSVQFSTSNLEGRSAYVQQLYLKWWKLWQAKIFPYLSPARKWRDVRTNLRKDDICLLFFPNMNANAYKHRTLKDAEGLVRTVHVVYRRGDKRDKAKTYQKNRMVEE